MQTSFLVFLIEYLFIVLYVLKTSINILRRTKNEERRTKNEERRTKNEERRTKNEERRTKYKIIVVFTIASIAINDLKNYCYCEKVIVEKKRNSREN